MTQTPFSRCSSAHRYAVGGSASGNFREQRKATLYSLSSSRLPSECIILQLDPELGAGLDVTHRETPSHVLLDDGLGHVEPDPGPLVGPFGGEVRIEILSMISSGIPPALSAMVMTDLLVLPLKTRSRSAAPRPFARRSVPCVHQDVEERPGSTRWGSRGMTSPRGRDIDCHFRCS